MTEKTHTVWDVKYAMLVQRLYDGVSFEQLTDEERELFHYCVKEGFLDLTDDDGNNVSL